MQHRRVDQHLADQMFMTGSYWIYINAPSSSIQTRYAQLQRIEYNTQSFEHCLAYLLMEMTLISERHNILEHALSMHRQLTLDVNVYVTPVWLAGDATIALEQRTV